MEFITLVDIFFVTIAISIPSIMIATTVSTPFYRNES